MGGGGGSLQAQKFELSHSVRYHLHQKAESPCPSPDWRPHIRKISVIAFRKILSNILPVECISSHTIMVNLKKFLGTKSFNTKQYLDGLSPRIIRHYLPEVLWKTLGMRRNPSQYPINYSFFPPEKSSLIILYFPLSKVSLISYHIAFMT